ncbi:MAG: type II toxin-antitoxin system RatA family toxin [Rickettsiaceae bacterium]|nr:type II toxin-antitoxin system RatA family toxin [Rickettsiaceae bacterium]
MPKFLESKKLDYTAYELYSLVIDIEKYPEFVPWCTEATILSNSENTVIAELFIKFGFVSHSYKSKIMHDKTDEGYFVNITQEEGPFKYLNTRWQFKKDGNRSSIVDFEIELELDSQIHNLILEGFFPTATKIMINSFEERARRIYGTN